MLPEQKYNNKLFKNKYRIDSTRLKKWDYSSDGYYFITICVKNRKRKFGFIKNGFLCLSPQGQIATECWYDLPNHYSNCILDKFVLMPNHLHGIILLNNQYNVETRHGASPQKNTINNDSNHDGHIRRFGLLKKNSISSIINHYKGAVTKLCNKKLGIKFQWQSRFYDHIIRNEKSLYKIRRYILNNPLQWEYDRNKPKLFVILRFCIFFLDKHIKIFLQYKYRGINSQNS